MKLCIGPQWEQTRIFLKELVSQAAAGKLSYRNARTNFILHLQKIGYLPDSDDWLTIDNLKSDARMRLILDANIGLRCSYLKCGSSAVDEVAVGVNPAWELVEMSRGSFQRDWPERWRDCGGKLFGKRMVALLNDPIWYNISAFPFPFPPFDFDDGMAVIAVSRTDAEALGLLSGDTKISVCPPLEPTALYYFDAFPDGKFPSVLPQEYGNEQNREEDVVSSGLYHESKYEKVAQVGNALKAGAIISQEDENKFLTKLGEAVKDGLENQPEWLARAYRYTGEIYFKRQELERAFEYYGYALQFDPKVGVKKQYSKLGKQLGKKIE